MKQPDSELKRLTNAWHDGTIAPEDALRLERRLLGDDAASEYFFEMAGIEAALPEAAARTAPVAIPFKPRSRAVWWAAAAAFVAGLFVGPMIWQPGTQEMTAALPNARTETPATAAMVTGMLGVSWDGVPELQSVALVAGGKESRIGSGLVELTFASGTRTVIEGPAEFQVSGDNSMSLARGRLVADVPKGAEGFTVTYPDGRIVDLGTEFGLEVDANGRSANFGVFRGEIEYHPQNDAARKIRLIENHAVVASEGKVLSVPFNRDKFARKMPTREFAWALEGNDSEPQVWDYDISHIVWTPGNYRVICKWMQGKHALVIRQAELLLDGKPVAEDRHTGVAGYFKNTRDNIYELKLVPDAYRRGRWSLRLHVDAHTSPGESVDCVGVVLVEEGIAAKATATDFVGTWEYLHNGTVYRRTFLPDGTARLTMDGENYPNFTGSHWTVEGGVLKLYVPVAGGYEICEEHILRDAQTLIFSNQSYRNARRVED